MKTLTMETAAALLGYPKPAANRQRVCSECEGELTWAVEITGAHPFGTGYDLLLCEECGVEAERKWTGF